MRFIKIFVFILSSLVFLSTLSAQDFLKGKDKKAYKKALSLIEQQNYKAAILSLNQLNQQYPYAYKIKLKLSDCYAALNNYENCISFLEGVIYDLDLKIKEIDGLVKKKDKQENELRELKRVKKEAEKNLEKYKAEDEAQKKKIEEQDKEVKKQQEPLIITPTNQDIEKHKQDISNKEGNQNSYSEQTEIEEDVAEKITLTNIDEKEQIKEITEILKKTYTNNYSETNSVEYSRVFEIMSDNNSNTFGNREKWLKNMAELYLKLSIDKDTLNSIRLEILQLNDKISNKKARVKGVENQLSLLEAEIKSIRISSSDLRKIKDQLLCNLSINRLIVYAKQNTITPTSTPTSKNVEQVIKDAAILGYQKETGNYNTIPRVTIEGFYPKEIDNWVLSKDHTFRFCNVTINPFCVNSTPISESLIAYKAIYFAKDTSFNIENNTIARNQFSFNEKIKKDDDFQYFKNIVLLNSDQSLKKETQFELQYKKSKDSFTNQKRQYGNIITGSESELYQINNQLDTLQELLKSKEIRYQAFYNNNYRSTLKDYYSLTNELSENYTTIVGIDKQSILNNKNVEFNNAASKAYQNLENFVASKYIFTPIIESKFSKDSLIVLNRFKGNFQAKINEAKVVEFQNIIQDSKKIFAAITFKISWVKNSEDLKEELKSTTSESNRNIEVTANNSDTNLNEDVVNNSDEIIPVNSSESNPKSQQEINENDAVVKKTTQKDFIILDSPQSYNNYIMYEQEKNKKYRVPDIIELENLLVDRELRSLLIDKFKTSTTRKIYLLSSNTFLDEDNYRMVKCIAFDMESTAFESAEMDAGDAGIVIVIKE